MILVKHVILMIFVHIFTWQRQPHIVVLPFQLHLSFLILIGLHKPL